jgi:hypothetical protein
LEIGGDVDQLDEFVLGGAELVEDVAEAAEVEFPERALDEQPAGLGGHAARLEGVRLPV